MTVPGSTTASEPYVLVIREGPSYAEQDIVTACELFSREFAGEYWTYGSYEADAMVSRFRMRVVFEDWRHPKASYWRFSKKIRARARELRQQGRRSVVVICSDPFKNGLLGLHVAGITRGRLIAEINGAYGNAFAFSQIKNPLVRSAKLAAFRSLGSFVLSRCAGIRLLFDSQLDAFRVRRDQAIVRRFHELTYTSKFYNAPEEPFVLLAGYPFLVKGADVLVKAFARIAGKHPEWRLVLIGHELALHLKEAGLEHPRIEVHPGKLQHELAEWVARCAILAQPSRTEAMGRILVEAAAAGKCRIATRVDGIPTVIEDGVDGLLVERDSVDQLAAVLDRAMGDTTLRRRLGEAAAERAAREFTGAKYIENYAELIRAAVASGSAQAAS
jgi:glycosyltransferase involved in cell wall biosynthesis